MNKIAIGVVLLVLFVAYVARSSVEGSDMPKEIERIETTNSSRIIYYTDGTKDAYFTMSSEVSAGASAGVAHVIQSPTSPPPSFPFEKIFDVLEEIIEKTAGSIGVGCSLIAWQIWKVIKRLRNDRPKDYHDLP